MSSSNLFILAMLVTTRIAIAATISIDWMRGFNGKTAANQGASASQGDMLEFTWSSSHNVYLVDQSFCNGKTWSTFTCPTTDAEYGLNLGSTSGATYTIPANPQSQYCFACKVSGHCAAGQYLIVNVATTRGSSGSAHSSSLQPLVMFLWVLYSWIF